MWKKILLIALLLIVLLFLAIIGSTYFLLGTEGGFQWTTSKLQNLDDRLTLAPSSGNLNEGIGTEQVSWEDDKLSVSATGIESKWSSSCLLKTAFCLQYLNINELTIETKESDDAKAETRTGAIVLPDVSLPLKFEAEEILIKKLRLISAGAAQPFELENITLTAEANGSDIRIDSLGLQYEQNTVMFEGDINLQGDYPIDATISVTAREVIDQHDARLTAQLSNTLANLKVNGNVSGIVDILANADIQPLQPKLPLRANLTWKQLGWPLEDHETVAASDGRLSVAGNLDNYHLRLQSALSGKDVPASQLNATGQVNAEQVIMPQIDLLLLDGAVAASMAANWNNGTNWVADLVFKHIDPGVKWQQLNGKLDGLVQVRGSASDGAWAMTVDQARVSGKFRDYPLQLESTAARSRQGTWLIPDFKLNNGRNNLSLQGSAGETLELDLEMAFPALNQLVPAVEGDLQGTASITGPLATPSLELTGDSSQLKVGEAIIKNLQLAASISDAGTSNSSLEVQVSEAISGEQKISAVKAQVDGTRATHQMTFSLRGPSQTSLALQGIGSLPDAPGSKAPSGDWAGKLQSVLLDVPGHALSLAEPVAVNWSQLRQRATVAAHCWNESSASLCLKNPVNSSTSGTADIDLSGYRLRKLNEFLPAGTRLEGQLGAASKLSWNANAANGFSATMDAQVENGAVVMATNTGSAAETLRLKYKTLNLTTNANAENVTAKLKLNSSQIGNADVALTLNPSTDNKEIEGKVTLDGLDLKIAKVFLPDFKQVDGTINVAGDLSGSLTEPLFNGKVELLNPVLKNDDLPLGIDGGNLGVIVTGNKADVSGELDTGEGSIKLGGNASWENQAVTANLTVEGENLSIVEGPLVYSEVHPDLKIAFKPGSLEVSGNIDIPAAEINIKEQSTAAASLSEDVVVIEDEIIAEKNEAAIAEGTALDIKTNLTVNLGDDVNLSGYGLNARLNGEIRVLKENDAPPQLGGEIRVAEGFYKSYGQDLTIKDGQILFVGPIEQTTLNIDAVREIDGEERIAGLQVEGAIADPSVTLFTEPPDKTQESILSYIVLGRDIGAETSNEESTLLARAALALTLNQGRGLATGFAESLGISEFQIDAAGSGDNTQVVVSGRLSRKLLLRYGRSVFVPDQTLYLRYDISKRLYLEAAQGVERAVDLFYSISF